MGRGRSNKKHGSPPSATRPSKRVKKKAGDKAAPALPPDAWAAVMEYLTVSDVISVSSTCRGIHYDAVPLVTSLHIRYAREMNPHLSQRFRDVREIFIYSLYEYDVGTPPPNRWAIDFESSVRAAPFLSNSFTKLERVYFGHVIKRNGELIFMPFIEDYGPSNDKNMSRLIDSISAAFRCGALPQHLIVRGLRCLKSSSGPSNCRVCRRACESFPLFSVLTFEFTQTSEDSGSYDIAVCLEKEQLEQILESRPGGREILRSNLRLLSLLGKGSVLSSSDESIGIIFFSESRLEEIRNAINYAQLDIRQLTSTELNEAIMKSLQNERHAPPPYACFLSEYSRQSLINLGLQVEEDMEQFKLKVLGQLKQITTELNSEYDSGIEDDLLSIVYKLVSLNDNPPTQEVIESEIISTLIDLVEIDCYDNYKNSQSSKMPIDIMAMLILDRTVNDIDHGTKLKWAAEISALVVDKVPTEHINDFSVTSCIINALDANFSVIIRSIAGFILSKICDHEGVIKHIVDANAIPTLSLSIGQNCQDQLARHLLSVLSCVANVSKAYRNDIVKTGIIKTMCSNLKNEKMCNEWTCFFECIVMNEDRDDTLVEEIIDSLGTITDMMTTFLFDSVPFRRVIDILSMILKLNRKCIIDEVVQAGAVPVIAKFIPNCIYRHTEEAALESLEIIVRASPKYCDELLKTDIIDQLCKGLRSKFSRVKGNCLSLIFCSMEHRGENGKQLVKKVVDLGLVSFLIKMVSTDEEDEHVLSCSIRILSLILFEQKSKATIHEIVEKGQIVNNLVRILQRSECSESLAEYILVLLYQIAKYSPFYRDHIMTSGVICHLKTGVKAKSIHTRKRWTALVYALVSHRDSKCTSQALVDCGAIKSLFELKLGSQEPVESMTIGILLTTRARFINKEKDHIDMLQKKRAWLVVKEYHKKADRLRMEYDSLKRLKFNESMKIGNDDVSRDLEQKLQEAKANLCEVQNLCKDAEDVAPHKKWHKRLEKIDLHSTDKVDQEILRSKLFIKEANSLIAKV